MPSVSEKQRCAMEAAAHGHSTLGIPKKVGEEFVAADDTAPQAAGIVHVAPDGRVLLLHRSPDEKNFGGHWGLPGGKAEDGETPEQAATRETREETGFQHEGTLKPMRRVRTPSGMIFTTFAAAVDKPFVPTMTDGEHTGYTWADLRHLPRPLHPQVEKLLGEQIDATTDMSPEDWGALRTNFVKWTREVESPMTASDAFAEGDHPRKKDGKFAPTGGHNESDRDAAKNIAKGIEKTSNEEDAARKKFPKGSMVKPNIQGAKPAKVIGHRGNMLELDNDKLLHVSKAVAADSVDGGMALDRASVRKYDGDDRLHIAITNISKANVCEYLGNEIPDFERLGLQAGRLYRLYRDPAELARAAPTFNNLPLLSQHVPVDARDHRPDLVVGSTGTDATFKPPFLQNSLVVWAGEAIKDVESENKKELSSAYRYRADMTSGTTPDGEAYDGVMRDIVGNHVALVKEGRAGPDVVVGDSKENLTMPKSVKMTRTGAAVRSVIALHIQPRLAQDARLDLRPILAKLTAKNFADQKAGIVKAIGAAAKGKLARDASIEDIAGLVDALEKAPIADGDDEVEVADLPEETMDAEGGDLREFLKGKLGEDDYARACELMAGHANDEDDDGDDERKSREREEKMAGDIEEAVKEKTKDMVDKKAMDAAIDVAVKAERKRAQDIADAREDVRPLVGTLKGAYDSADGVYQAALGVLGVADADKITGLPALKAVLKAQTLRTPVAKPAPAMDAAATKSLAERFPHAAKIKVSA